MIRRTHPIRDAGARSRGAVSTLALVAALCVPALASAQPSGEVVATSGTAPAGLSPAAGEPVMLAEAQPPGVAPESPSPPTPASGIAPTPGGPTRTPATPAASTEGVGPSTAVAGAVSSEAVPAAEPPPPPSELVAINLVRLLVKQGVITQAAADELITQARSEAQQARVASAAPGPGAPPPGVIRVPYVPQVVKDQIREELKTEVMAQAKSQGWAAPGLIPEWVNRITWGGDLRFRDQFNLYDKNNIAPYIDYASFNANGPTDVNATTNPNGLPFLNTRTDRDDLLSIRARFGLTAQINDIVSTTIRLATGSSDGPVSTTQLLGGGFDKKDIWLDQAFIKISPADFINVAVGRIPNPFDSSLLLFAESLNFDGAAASAAMPVEDTGLKVRGVAGAFPIGYIGSNFPGDAAVKSGDRTSWLFAAQGGADFQPRPGSWIAHGSVAYYDYSALKGAPSTPCALYDGNKVCSSDDTAPAFMQKGNTLFLLRNITPDPNSPLNFAQPQLAGLAYDYRLLDVRGSFELPLFGANRALFEAEYVRNLAYHPAKVLANPLTQPITNFDTSSSGATTYRSGPNGFRLSAWVGNLTPVNRGDWNVLAGYTYTEPDAVPDGFNDYDFHLGGTNAKGYFVLGNYFFARNSWLSGRWLSSDQVFGPPLAIDVAFLDLNTRF